MELIKYLMAISVVFISVGCLGTRTDEKVDKLQTYTGTIHEINDIIFKTDKLILNKVSENGIDTGSVKLIHDITVQFDTCYDKLSDSAKMSHIVNSLEKVQIHSNWITAFVVLNENYAAKSTTSTFIKRPEVYNDYKIEKELIKLDKSNNYIAYITFLGCYSEYYLGFKNRKIDLLKKVDDNHVSFVTSRSNPIQDILKVYMLSD